MHISPPTVEGVVRHHLEALGNNDLAELLKDYTEKSEIWTVNGPFVGIAAISGFFSATFTLLPVHSTTFEIKHMIVKGNKCYIVWIAENPLVSIPMGSDSFELKDGKIVWQSVVSYSILK
jgi:ketosteroid isomerase-like protein